MFCNVYHMEERVLPPRTTRLLNEATRAIKELRLIALSFLQGPKRRKWLAPNHLASNSWHWDWNTSFLNQQIFFSIVPGRQNKTANSISPLVLPSPEKITPSVPGSFHLGFGNFTSHSGNSCRKSESNYFEDICYFYVFLYVPFFGQEEIRILEMHLI